MSESTLTASTTYPLRKKLIDIFLGEVGVREVPRNSNRGPRIQEYQRATDLAGTGWAYCAAFMCWGIMKWGEDSAVRDALKLTRDGFEAWRPKTAAAYGFEDWARRKRLLVHNENARPGKLTLHTGDLMTFDISHIGALITDYESSSYALWRMETVEGNTNASGSRDGGGVYRMERARSFARCFIRLLD